MTEPRYDERTLAMVVSDLDLGIDTAASLWMGAADGTGEEWNAAFEWARSCTSRERDYSDDMEDAIVRLRVDLAAAEARATAAEQERDEAKSPAGIARAAAEVASTTTIGYAEAYWAVATGSELIGWKARATAAEAKAAAGLALVPRCTNFTSHDCAWMGRDINSPYGADGYSITVSACIECKVRAALRGDQ